MGADLWQETTDTRAKGEHSNILAYPNQDHRPHKYQPRNMQICIHEQRKPPDQTIAAERKIARKTRNIFKTFHRTVGWPRTNCTKETRGDPGSKQYPNTFWHYEQTNRENHSAQLKISRGVDTAAILPGFTKDLWGVTQWQTLAALWKIQHLWKGSGITIVYSQDIQPG